MRMLDLFSGIGGISLAADWAEIETVAFCEIEPFCQKVLKKHWPDVPIIADVKDVTKQSLIDLDVIDHGGTRTIDIVCAGYPCQPFSVAGKREGEGDDRHLWPEVIRIIEELRPRWFVGENVAGHITMGLDQVLSDLGRANYTCQSFLIPAAAVGTPHRRDRVFIVGYTEHHGHAAPTIRGSINPASNWEQEGQNQAGESSGTSRSGNDEVMANPDCQRESQSSGDIKESGERAFYSGQVVAHSYGKGLQRTSNSGEVGRGGEECVEQFVRCDQSQTSRQSQSGMGGMLDGLSDRLDGYRWPAGLGQEQHDWEPPRVITGVKHRAPRLKGLGNAVVPQQIYPILVAIKQIDDQLQLTM